MEVALFVPCYVDQFYPGAARATLELLEKLGVNVHYPEGQTCCGQPMANSGYEHLTGGCNENFVEHFKDYEYIVSPSGSCVLHIKEHLHSGKQPAQGEEIRHKIYELTEFLTDILQVEALDARFPYKVGVHQSCHGQRGLKLSQMSELTAPAFSKPGKLLQMVKDIELIPLDRIDECCGFGGTFCVAEEAVSVKMGKDRVADHLRHGAEYITGADMSCLMHMEGILRREKSQTKVIHIAEILNSW
ncbi:(Fe-S)-binding protein [Olivibacter ginsenosidimutans]|uniref:(Fe-S)-binding protein n=1 Tax=Olivibacter ginsenosidimutans TaxID=1176537 RepID=A0ABP9BYH9_9SPHI